MHHRGVIHLPYGGDMTGHGALKSRIYITLTLNLKIEAKGVGCRLQLNMDYSVSRKL